MVENKFYIHEAELGNQLSHSVHESRRNDFSLMLAMLVDDIREHSQFHQPQTQAEKPQDSELQLRRQLAVNTPAPMSDEKLSYAHHAQAVNISQGRQDTMRLQNALAKAPLAQFDQPQRVTSKVLENVSGYSKSRYLEKVSTKETLQQRKSLDVELLVNTIKVSQLKAQTQLVA